MAPALRWAEVVNGAPAVLEVPTDQLRRRDIGEEVATEMIPLDASISERLRTGAVALGTSPAEVLTCIWAAYVARVSDQHEVVLGDVSNGADAVQLRRFQCPPESTLAGLLAQQRSSRVDLADVAPVSLEELIVILGAEPASNKHPVFQIAVAELRAPNLASARIAADAYAPCDLVFGVHAGDGSALCIQYSPALYSRARIRRMLAHLVLLLDVGLRSPERPLEESALVTGEERAQIESWNDTDRAMDPARTLVDLLAAQVEVTPDVIAVELLGAGITYRELDRRAETLAAQLRTMGVGPDVLVAVSIERSVEMIVALIGVLKAGGAYVPVDPAYPQQRRDYIAADAQVAAMVRQSANGALTVEAVGQPISRRADNASEAAGARLAYVIYTSGSTGQPKGVAITHASAVNLLEWQRARAGFRPGARTLQFTSLSFDVSVQEIFSTLVSGGTLVLVADETRRNPLTMLDHMIEHRVERLFLPFVALRGLANAACTTERFPTALVEVYTAGEQLQVDDTIRSFFGALPGAILENQYGPTEATVILTAHTMPDGAASWEPLPPIGGPIHNVHTYVLDRHQRPQPIGVPGELYIAGACLAREYLGKPELTAERFVTIRHEDGTTERAYRAGDIARWRADGTVEFLGRADNQVKFRGYRIEPGEVGAALSNHPHVEQCMAAIRQVEGSGPRLVAYVKSSSSSLDLEDLHRFARTVLPEHMVPSHMTVVDEFPQTPSGKIDMQALPTPAFNRQILGVRFKEPRSITEIRLSAIWSRLLGVERPGMDDDFFALGGDSLMAVEMFAQIRAEFGRELPLGALAASPTIGQFAKKIDASGEDDWSIIVPLQTQGDKRPLFCIHGGSGNVATFPLLARALPGDQPFYALQWDGLSGSPGTKTIPGMATVYAEEIRRVQPHGPYLLAGQCIGGLIAQEMAGQFVAAGEQVDLLVMYDSPNVFSDTHLAPTAREKIERLWRDSAKKTRARNAFGMARRHLKVRIKRRVTTDFRHLYAIDTLCRATARHRPNVPGVPTVLFSTGETNASLIGLEGRWIDDALGWSPSASEQFRIQHIEGGHTEIMYSAEATAVVRAALEEADASRRAHPQSPKRSA